MAKYATNVSGAILLPSSIQVMESISGSVVPLAMFFIKQHFGFGGTNIHSEILWLCLVFVNFDNKIFHSLGQSGRGGGCALKKCVTIGNRISHGHSWGAEVTEGLIKGHYFFAPFPQLQRMQFTHLIRHKLTLFGRGPRQKMDNS